MIERIESKGYWYLPENPEETVAGILTYVPNKSITLELIGSFKKEKVSFEILFKNRTEKIIHGIISDAKKITLVNCYSSESRNFSCPFSIIKYNCQYLIIGKHIQGLADPSFYKVSILFPSLTYWCLPDALQSSMEFNESKLISVSFKAKEGNNEMTINKTQIDDNISLYLKKEAKFQGSNFLLTPKFEQYTSLEIHKQNDSPIEDYLPIIFQYEQFLSLATLEIVQCSKILLYDNSLFQQLEKGKKIYHPVELIYVQHDGNSFFPHNNRINFLFVYHTIEEQYSQIIRKWLTENEDITPIRAHLIESIKHKSVFSSIDFLIVIQALEGYCTRFRKKDTLTNMLNNLISEFSAIDKIKGDNINIKEVVNSRHYYSHFMKKSEKTHIVDGVELFRLTHKLRKLLISCLLKFIGFENSQINEILNSSHSSLLSGSMQFEEIE